MVRSALLRSVLVAALVLLLAAGTASATEQRVNSEPGGHFALFVHARSDTDRDRDRNPDTATHGDRLYVFADVCTRFNEAQIVQYEVIVDRPGTAFDEQRAGTADLVTYSCVGGFFTDERVVKKWGVGEYRITMRATSDNGDTATASASIAIH